MSRWEWVVEALPGLSGLPDSGDERADKLILRALDRALERQARGEPGHAIRCSRSQLQQWMQEGRVVVDGSPIVPRAPLRAGAKVEIDFPAAEPSALVPEERELEILYEDEHVVVVNKPQGLTVHPSPTQRSGTLVHALLHRYGGRLATGGGEERPGVVHRIDKDTSGALVLARTDQAYFDLVPQFARHSIQRTYWALCFGAPEATTGRVESTIGRSPSDRTKMAMNVPGGKPAVTHFEVLRRFAQPRAKAFASRLELRLETGRTHQIRVHMHSLGASLLGDRTYGQPTERHPKWLALPREIQQIVIALPGQALHARSLGFEHPVTKAPVRVEAEPPARFRELLALLEGYS